MNQEEFTPVEKLTYAQAIGELEAILRDLQSDNCDIDRLSILTRRAVELIGSCRSRLTTTETDLRTILAQLEGENA